MPTGLGNGNVGSCYSGSLPRCEAPAPFWNMRWITFSAAQEASGSSKLWGLCDGPLWVIVDWQISGPCAEFCCIAQCVNRALLS